jgi:RNA polymerase sigma factor (sigma-70 family)
MAAAPFGTVFRHLLQRFGVRQAGDPSDAGLLARFATSRDESAFAELVQRHGPMVLGVCRRILRDEHAAEDAFQASFLVLARKAAALDRQRPLGSWLYTVARNLALEHRSAAVSRRAREKEAAAMATLVSADETAWREVCDILDAELGCLPEKYRAPLVLCHLQGMTHEAAARELGWPAGSMAKRLTRGQELLRARLMRRGVTLSAAGLAALMQENASAAVTAATACQISRAAALYAAGEATADLVSTQASALAAHALRALSPARWQLAAALALTAGFLGAGTAIFHQPAKPEAVAAMPARTDQPAPEPEEDPLDQAVRQKLFTSVTLDRGIDALPLKEVASFLSDRYDLKIRVDEDAFAAAGVNGVQDHQVSLSRVVLPLGTALDVLLRQIEPLDGRVSSYRVEKGTVVIGPAIFAYRPQERVPPGLPPRLFKQVACDQEPYDMSLAAALEMYGKVYGQKLVVDRRAFVAVGEADADKYPLAGRGRDLSEQPCLLEVLELILWQTEGDNWKSYFRVRDGAIEITAARAGSEQAALLEKQVAQMHEYWSLWTSQVLQDASPRKPLFLAYNVDKAVPLQDALEFLSDRYDLTILVDGQAFAAAGMDKIGERDVQFPVQKKPLSRLEYLRLFLEQVRGGDYTADCVYHRAGYFEVIPRHAQLRNNKPLEARHLEELWRDLESPSGARGRLAEQTLVQAPREALAYLRQHLKPATPLAPQHADLINKLIADLESDQFAARQKATAALENLGQEAVPALRARREQDPPLDATLRINQILKKLMGRSVRALRAVRVLEAIGSGEARQLLESLAAGERSAPSTAAARAALQQLRPPSEANR